MTTSRRYSQHLETVHVVDRKAARDSQKLPAGDTPTQLLCPVLPSKSGPAGGMEDEDRPLQVRSASLSCSLPLGAAAGAPPDLTTAASADLSMDRLNLR